MEGAWIRSAGEKVLLRRGLRHEVTGLGDQSVTGHHDGRDSGGQSGAHFQSSAGSNGGRVGWGQRSAVLVRAAWLLRPGAGVRQMEDALDSNCLKDSIGAGVRTDEQLLVG